MSNSVENRSPYLEIDVLELGYSLPVASLIREGFSKYPLRKSFEDLIPSEIFGRGKKLALTYHLGIWRRVQKKESVK